MLKLCLDYVPDQVVGIDPLGFNTSAQMEDTALRASVPTKVG